VITLDGWERGVGSLQLALTPEEIGGMFFLLDQNGTGCV
jgi:hypothetical protein